MGIRDEDTIRKALDSLREVRGYAYVEEIENPTMLNLDAMRQRCLEASHLLNDETPTLDAVALIKKMNNQRNLFMEYIKMLEAFIKNHYSEKSDNECPRCGGTGMVEDPCNHLAFFKTCEICEGTGILKANEEKDIES